jgi:hypothetical protein
MAKASEIIRYIATYLPPMLAVAETVVRAIESGDTGTLTAIVDAAGAGDATGQSAPAPDAPAPTEGKVKRGPGRPPKSTAAAPAKATAESITTLCGTKLAELAGKLDGDEAKARQLIREAVKGAAGVERVKEVPEGKLQAVYDAVDALDAAPAGGDAEEF